MNKKEVKIGIYRIHDNVNNLDYIGQSIDIDLRIKYHFKYGNLKMHIDRALHQRPQDFSWNIVELTTIDKLDQQEIYWIKKFNSYENGYNHSTGGSGPHNNSSISKMVYQYDYTYSTIINKFYSLSDAARFMKVSVAAICDVCKGHSFNGKNCFHCEKYGFVYADETEEVIKRNILFKDRIFAVIPLNSLEIPQCKIIKTYNRQTDIIKEYGFNSSSLSSCINNKRRCVISNNNIKYLVCKLIDLEQRLFNFGEEQILKTIKENNIQYFININAFCKEIGYNWQRVNYSIQKDILLDGYKCSLVNKNDFIEFEEKVDA